MKKENKVSLTKRILIIISLLVIIIMSGVSNTISYAATYSTERISIAVPEKYTVSSSNSNEDYESKTFEYVDRETDSPELLGTVIGYRVEPTTKVTYTQEDLDNMCTNIKNEIEEYDLCIEFINKDFVGINGCKGIRITYYYYLPRSSWLGWIDDYYLLTDNYQVNLYFDTNIRGYIGSQEQQNVIRSFKIKDTVLKSRGIPFTDVAGDSWYYKAVKYSYENNMIKGLNDYTFAPNQNLTRGMLVTILWRMEGSPKVTSNQFTDVSSKEYYYDAVNWAASKKIVNGYGNGKFGPNDLITREQLAVMLRNYALHKEKDVSAREDLSKFKDNTKISDYAKDAVSWAVANKIISGKSEGTRIDPHGKATRAEAASMLYSYCMNIK